MAIKDELQLSRVHSEALIAVCLVRPVLRQFKDQKSLVHALLLPVKACYLVLPFRDTLFHLLHELLARRTVARPEVTVLCALQAPILPSRKAMTGHVHPPGEAVLLQTSKKRNEVASIKRANV